MNKLFAIGAATLTCATLFFGEFVSAETTTISPQSELAADIFCSCSNKRGQASAAQCPKGKSLGCLLRPDTPQGWCVAECYNEKNEKEVGKKIPCPFNNGEGDCSIIGDKSIDAATPGKTDF